MKRFILTVAIVSFTAILSNVSVVEGSGKPPGSNKGGSSSHSMHSHKQQSRYSGRYFGRDYRNWSRYCWFPRYNCYGYCCPSDGVWFYWCEEQGRYLPISELANYPPTTTGQAPPGRGETGSLPPGATEVPDPPDTK
jgi:hypothetical protein